MSDLDLAEEKLGLVSVFLLVKASWLLGEVGMCQVISGRRGLGAGCVMGLNCGWIPPVHQEVKKELLFPLSAALRLGGVAGGKCAHCLSPRGLIRSSGEPRRGSAMDGQRI